MGRGTLGLPGEGLEPYNQCPRHSVQWEPVQYFNNKIICDLVEEKFKGIISILVCVLCSSSLALGNRWEASFLSKCVHWVRVWGWAE